MTICPRNSRPILGSHSTLSLTSMLLCVLSCALVLPRAATDQTGETFANISESFESTLNPFGSFAAGNTNNHCDSVWSIDRPSTTLDQVKSNPRRRLEDEEWPPSYDDHSESTGDSTRLVFENFVSELGRFALTSKAVNYAGEITIDFLFPVVAHQDQIDQLIFQTVQMATTEFHASTLDFEVIVWANTPRPGSLVEAALKAGNLKSDLTNRLPSELKTKLEFSSSGRVWTSKTVLRPCVTMVIRNSTE